MTSRRVLARRSPRRAHGDSGATFVELLVSIVLVGTVVVGTLVALRTTIVANDVNDDRARLVAWLQNGVDAVHRTAYIPCTSGLPAVSAAYQAALDAVPPPDGWTGGSLQVLQVEFASVDNARHVDQWSTSCDTGRPAQLVALEATSPDGEVVEAAELIRDG